MFRKYIVLYHSKHKKTRLKQAELWVQSQYTNPPYSQVGFPDTFTT